MTRSPGELAARYDALGEGDAAHLDDLAWYAAHLTATSGPVLELGAGTGRVTRALLGGGHEILPLDRDADALAILKRRGHQPATRAMSVVCADLTQLPFRGSPPFAAVVCAYNTLGCLLAREDLRAAFQEVLRVLAPSAPFLLDVGETRLGDLPREKTRFEWEPRELPEGGWLARRMTIHARSGRERVEIGFEYRLATAQGDVLREERSALVLNTWPIDTYTDAARHEGFTIETADTRTYAGADGPVPMWAFLALRAPARHARGETETGWRPRTHP